MSRSGCYGGRSRSNQPSDRATAADPAAQRQAGPVQITVTADAVYSVKQPNETWRQASRLERLDRDKLSYMSQKVINTAVLPRGAYHRRPAASFGDYKQQLRKSMQLFPSGKVVKASKNRRVAFGQGQARKRNATAVGGIKIGSYPFAAKEQGPAGTKLRSQPKNKSMAATLGTQSNLDEKHGGQSSRRGREVECQTMSDLGKQYEMDVLDLKQPVFPGGEQQLPMGFDDATPSDANDVADTVYASYNAHSQSFNYQQLMTYVQPQRQLQLASQESIQSHQYGDVQSSMQALYQPSQPVQSQGQGGQADYLRHQSPLPRSSCADRFPQNQHDPAQELSGSFADYTNASGLSPDVAQKQSSPPRKAAPLPPARRRGQSPAADSTIRAVNQRHNSSIKPSTRVHDLRPAEEPPALHTVDGRSAPWTAGTSQHHHSYYSSDRKAVELGRAQPRRPEAQKGSAKLRKQLESQLQLLRPQALPPGGSRGRALKYPERGYIPPTAMQIQSIDPPKQRLASRQSDLQPMLDYAPAASLPLYLYDLGGHSCGLADAKRRGASLSGSNAGSRGESRSRPISRVTSGGGIHLEVHSIKGGDRADDTDSAAATDLNAANANKGPLSSSGLSPVSRQLYTYANDACREDVLQLPGGSGGSGRPDRKRSPPRKTVSSKHVSNYTDTLRLESPDPDGGARNSAAEMTADPAACQGASATYGGRASIIDVQVMLTEVSDDDAFARADEEQYVQGANSTAGQTEYRVDHPREGHRELASGRGASEHSDNSNALDYSQASVGRRAVFQKSFANREERASASQGSIPLLEHGMGVKVYRERRERDDNTGDAGAKAPPFYSRHLLRLRDELKDQAFAEDALLRQSMRFNTSGPVTAAQTVTHYDQIMQMDQATLDQRKAPPKVPRQADTAQLSPKTAQWMIGPKASPHQHTRAAHFYMKPSMSNYVPTHKFDSSNLTPENRNAKADEPAACNIVGVAQPEEGGGAQSPTQRSRGSQTSRKRRPLSGKQRTHSGRHSSRSGVSSRSPKHRTGVKLDTVFLGEAGPPLEPRKQNSDVSLGRVLAAQGQRNSESTHTHGSRMTFTGLSSRKVHDIRRPLGEEVGTECAGHNQELPGNDEPVSLSVLDQAAGSAEARGGQREPRLQAKVDPGVVRRTEEEVRKAIIAPNAGLMLQQQSHQQLPLKQVAVYSVYNSGAVNSQRSPEAQFVAQLVTREARSVLQSGQRRLRPSRAQATRFPQQPAQAAASGSVVKGGQGSCIVPALSASRSRTADLRVAFNCGGSHGAAPPGSRQARDRETGMGSTGSAGHAWGSTAALRHQDEPVSYEDANTLALKHSEAISALRAQQDRQRAELNKARSHSLVMAQQHPRDVPLAQHAQSSIQQKMTQLNRHHSKMILLQRAAQTEGSRGGASASVAWPGQQLPVAAPVPDASALRLTRESTLCHTPGPVTPLEPARQTDSARALAKVDMPSTTESPAPLKPHLQNLVGERAAGRTGGPGATRDSQVQAAYSRLKLPLRFNKTSSMSVGTQSSLMLSPAASDKNLDLSGAVLQHPSKRADSFEEPYRNPASRASVSRIESQMARLRKARQRKVVKDARDVEHYAKIEQNARQEYGAGRSRHAANRAAGVDRTSLRHSWAQSVSSHGALDSPGKRPMQVIVSVGGEPQGARIGHMSLTGSPPRQRDTSQGSELSDEMLAIGASVHEAQRRHKSRTQPQNQKKSTNEAYMAPESESGRGEKQTTLAL